MDCRLSGCRGTPGIPLTLRRVWAAMAPAAALGMAVWLSPAESQAAPTCTSKPAVCDRLAASQPRRAEPLLVQAQPARPIVARNVAPAATCSTKPAVCARDAARGVRPASPPVTLASARAGTRCDTKPAVCARLRVRPTASPIIMATTAGDAR
jgi:hypothetical protein